MFQGMAILYIRLKGKDVKRDVKSTDGRLRGQEKKKQKSVRLGKMEKHILILHWRVQDSYYLTFTAHRDGRWETR